MNALLLWATLSCRCADGSEFSPAIQAKVLEATVRIVHPASHGEGSGVVIRYENGFAYVLTAAHVLPTMTSGDDVEVFFFPRGKSRADIVPIKTQLKPRSRMLNEDLAVIEIGLKDPPPAVAPLCPKEAAPPRNLNATPPKNADEPPRDEPISVLASGIGLIGLPETVIDRIRLHTIPKKPDGTRSFHWEADQEQPVGRSGGGLFDREGRVIGICSGNMNKKAYYVSIYEIQKSLSSNAWGFLTKAPASSTAESGTEKMPPVRKKN